MVVKMKWRGTTTSPTERVREAIKHLHFDENDMEHGDLRSEDVLYQTYNDDVVRTIRRGTVPRQPLAGRVRSHWTYH